MLRPATIKYGDAICEYRQMSKGILVDGMSCDGCEEIVENAITDLEGVETAEANHESGAVKIEVTNNPPSVEALIESVEFAGYEASVPGAEDD